VKARRLLADEKGTTMAELLVGMAAGMIILAGLTTLVVLTLHSTARTSARVDATSRARLALDRLVDELHSACVAPKAAPIRGGSTGTKLVFVHATGAAAAPVPILSVVALTGTSLVQADYAWKEGSSPFWVFEEKKPVKEFTLLTNVSQITATKPVFSYYASAASATSEIALGTPLIQTDAERTIHVDVAFMASPSRGVATEQATPARMRGGATFRLSAVSYNEAAPALPCQ
jgi:Tfp pilus assembly protein PilW